MSHKKSRWYERKKRLLGLQSNDDKKLCQKCLSKQHFTHECKLNSIKYRRHESATQKLNKLSNKSGKELQRALKATPTLPPDEMEKRMKRKALRQLIKQTKGNRETIKKKQKNRKKHKHTKRKRKRSYDSSSDDEDSDSSVSSSCSSSSRSSASSSSSRSSSCSSSSSSASDSGSDSESGSESSSDEDHDGHHANRKRKRKREKDVECKKSTEMPQRKRRRVNEEQT